jgi:transcriptional regulator with XRE-family HTH domain
VPVDEKNGLGGRFAEERGRLGLGVQELADLCGVTRQQISRIERGGNAPGGEVLAAVGKAGGDIRYILLGERSGQIDLQLLGACEAALRAAYGGLRPGPIGTVRSRMTASLYNMVMRTKKPSDDDTSLAMAYASQLLMSLDDPSDPELLERNLFVPIAERATGGVTVTGDSNRVAGRDMIRGGKGKA